MESRLPEILEGISAPRTPDYFDDILGQVGRTRQRPRWTFPERWLPMTALSERVATAPRIPMRMAVVLALLLLALALSIVLIAGSQRPSVPAPFGVAGNGKVVFADQSGAIVTGNVSDGTTKVIVSGSGHSRPVFSPDGTLLAYLQRGGRDIVVSDPDGLSPRVLNTNALGTIGHFGWAPDSRSVIAVIGSDIIAFDAARAREPKVIVKADGGTSFSYLDRFNNNLSDLFRPPNGDEILFVGKGPKGMGLYRKPLAGGAPIAVVTDQDLDSTWSSNQSGAQWSPDGTKIVFSVHPAATPDFGFAYVANADGTDLRRLTKFDIPDAVIDEEHASWSPDGTRIALARWINYPDGNVDPRPVVIVDVATGHEVEASNREVNGYNGWSWSPDGSLILEVPGDGSDDAAKVMQVDAGTGQASELGWTSPNAASWQRTVPTN
ncbi:MAG TPA: hypothetical protein VFN41_15855 [Candidatus Limnocylindrales bacterium]|nr:hypothetical protein [Candidatus Limnocylindrales bacterium]